MIQKVEIDRDKPLSPDDIIELHFKTVGMVWLQASQLALIERRLKNKPGFQILSWSIQDKTKVIFKVKIIKTNPIIVTAAIIGGLVIAAGVLAWMTLDKVYQIMDSPAGKIAAGGLGSLAIVAAIAGLLVLLPKKG